MSPNEFQLRAALHDGEGDPLDPDRLIAHAVGVRRERQRKINMTVAGGAAVAVVGLCASAFVVFGGNGDSSGSGDAGAAAAPDRAAVTSHAASAGTTAAAGAGLPAPRTSQGASSSASSGALTGAGCPTTPDHYALPGGGGLGRFGSTTPLFAEEITSIRVCSYPVRASYVPGVSTLTGAAAQSIVSKLEAAPSRRTNGVCPANADFAGGTLELIGITSSGRELPGVVITLGCPSSQVTNGTAVRYPRSLPLNLLRQLFPALTKSTAANAPGSPTK